MGNKGAAAETERAIEYFHPEILFFVGVAGGLKDVQIGDVVAGTKAYGYESGKADATGSRIRPSVFNSTYRMEHLARATARNGDWLQRLQRTQSDPVPQCYVGPIASGEQVIASTDSETWKLLKQSFGDALAVEMEGHGFLRALHANQHVEALIVRGISDLIDEKDIADATNSQEVAAQNAAAFTFELLSRLASQKADNDQS